MILKTRILASQWETMEMKMRLWKTRLPINLFPNLQSWMMTLRQLLLLTCQQLHADEKDAVADHKEEITNEQVKEATPQALEEVAKDVNDLPSNYIYLDIQIIVRMFLVQLVKFWIIFFP